MYFMNLFFKILLYSARRFFAEKRLLWAASLTYTTVFSLIPLLSVLFFVFNIFGSLAEIKTRVQPYIYKTLAPWAQEKVISILNELVNNIDFSTIGFFSASLLIVSIFLLIFEIEYALNEIWLIKVKASALSRAAIYWIFLTIGPVLIALALFIFFTVQAYIPLEFIDVYMSAHGVALLSYVLILSSFTVIYYLMPGTPVCFTSAVLGGLAASTLWKLSGIAFNIYASRFFFYYPKIFGSLAAIPLFLLWIFLCWLLFLYGAEVAYIHQNRFFYRNSHATPVIEGHLRSYYLLIVFLFLAREYHGQEKPVSLKHTALSLNIPLHIVQVLIDGLLRCGLLVETMNPKSCYQPARPFPSQTLTDLVSATLRNFCMPTSMTLCMRLQFSFSRQTLLTAQAKP
jgi:membrane protein